jgi:hypothetical protein
MILFFDFERLLYGQTIGDIGPAARLAKVLMPYPQVDLVLTRWRIGAMRSVDDVRGEVPELGERINDVAHRPVRSDEQPNARSPARCAGRGSSTGRPWCRTGKHRATSSRRPARVRR